MQQAASLYFTNWGYTICAPDGSPTSLMTIDVEDLSIEDKLRRAWYYLGRGISDVLGDGFQFITLISDTKVIDQLDGVIIEDEDCITMARSIRVNGLPKFLHYELRKVTHNAIVDKFNEAGKELRG